MLLLFPEIICFTSAGCGCVLWARGSRQKWGQTNPFPQTLLLMLRYASVIFPFLLFVCFSIYECGAWLRVSGAGIGQSHKATGGAATASQYKRCKNNGANKQNRYKIGSRNICPSPCLVGPAMVPWYKFAS